MGTRQPGHRGPLSGPRPCALDAKRCSCPVVACMGLQLPLFPAASVDASFVSDNDSSRRVVDRPRRRCPAAAGNLPIRGLAFAETGALAGAGQAVAHVSSNGPPRSISRGFPPDCLLPGSVIPPPAIHCV